MTPELAKTLNKLEIGLSVIDIEADIIPPTPLSFIMKIAVNQLFIKAKKLKATREDLRKAMGLSTPRIVAQSNGS